MDGSIDINSNEYVQFKNQNTVMAIGNSGTRKFEVTSSVKLECFGNVNSMINFSNKLYAKCYNYMFNSLNITTAPELPATNLAEDCYANMFYNCISLTTAPELPATTLADSCYNRMFNLCISLTSAPSILPATNLAYECYKQMFNDCTSLIEAPELLATNLRRLPLLL